MDPAATAASHDPTAPQPSPEVIRHFQDRGCQWHNEDPKIAEEFVRLVDPVIGGALNWSAPVRGARDLLGSDLSIFSNDVFWEVSLDGRPVTVEIEHKGNDETDFPVQIARYQHLHREKQLRLGTRPADLRASIPILHYTAEKLFGGPLTLQELIRPHPLIARWNTQAPPLIFDLHRRDPAELEAADTLAAWALRVQQASAGAAEEFAGVVTRVLARLAREPEARERQVVRTAWFVLLTVQHRRPASEYNRYEAQVRAWGRRRRQAVREAVAKMPTTMADVLREDGIRIGVEIGRGEGLEIGRGEGIETGIETGVRNSVRSVLERRFGELPEAVLGAIERAGLERLNQWLLAAVGVSRLEEIHFGDPSSEPSFNGRVPLN